MKTQTFILFKHTSNSNLDVVTLFFKAIKDEVHTNNLNKKY